MNNLTVSSASCDEALLLDNRIFPDGYTPKMLEGDNCKYLFLLRSNDIPIGYCYLHGDEEEIEIYRFGIIKEYQRQGCGRFFLEEILHLVSTARFLLEVRSKNVPARHLYRQAGFNEYSRRKNYYEDRDDAIMMELRK